MLYTPVVIQCNKIIICHWLLREEGMVLESVRGFPKTLVPEDSKCSNAHPKLLFLDSGKEARARLLVNDAINPAQVL